MSALGRLVFAPDGTFGGVYTDSLRAYYAALGPSKTVRAGHVEPEGDGWVVTLEPWVLPNDSGRLRSQPFASRAQALAWEDRMVDYAIQRGYRPGP